jgi:hypothetical protein
VSATAEIIRFADHSQQFRRDETDRVLWGIQGGLKPWRIAEAIGTTEHHVTRIIDALRLTGRL